MRIYELSDRPEAVQKRIEADGIGDVKRFCGKAPKTKRDMNALWKQTVLSYPRFYEDYGATANVDFRARRLGERTYVFVFMYTDYQDHGKTMASMLDSFED